jgi:N6-L-threonylcarbamoyladenine synthase
LRVSVVYVQNRRGDALMPTSPRKAKRLLKKGSAVVIRRTPFSIKLTTATGETKQSITLGIDSGYNKIGISAITEEKELCAIDLSLRTDLVKLNSERKTYRRNRRGRKTWYRESRFNNRKKAKNWLAPSIQNKFDSHIKIVNKVKKLIPISKINIEIAAFDIQKIKTPEIFGVDYRLGVQKNFWNVREYVLYRDGHCCQHCKGKSKNRILEVHHILSRQTGGDRPGNLATLCSSCHEKVSKGKVVLSITRQNGFKAETFMTMVRWMLIYRLRVAGDLVSHTYGYVTKSKRIELGLIKSHVNDAFVIAGGTNQTRLQYQCFVKQVRKCNRKLYKGDRSHIKNTAKRFIHGFKRFDKVLWEGSEFFVFGRRVSGYFHLRSLDGLQNKPSVHWCKLKLLETGGTFLIQMGRVK